MRKMLSTALLVLLTGCVNLQKLEVVDHVDDHTNFAAIRTYTWAVGWPAGELEQHTRIVAAINKELAAHQLTESANGHADVTVDYGVLWRTDGDLSLAGKVPDREIPSFPVMTLSVRVRDAGTGQDVYTARSDARVDAWGQVSATTLTTEVDRMFERYPIPKSTP